MKTVSFRATTTTAETEREGKVIVSGVLRAGTFNNFAVTHENARNTSLAFLDAIATNGGATGQGSHPTFFSERAIGQSAIVWRGGDWDDVRGLSLRGEWLQTDAGRNARAEAEAGVPFGVSIYATTNEEGTELDEILFVDAVYIPAVPNRVVSYAQQDDTMNDKELVEEVDEIAPISAMGGEQQESDLDEADSPTNAVMFSAEEVKQMVADAVRAELATHQPHARKSIPAKSSVPDAPKAPIAFGSALVEAGRTITPARRAPKDKTAALTAHYRQWNKATLTQEEAAMRNAMQFNLDWSGLPAPCTATAALYELVCESSYINSIFPSGTMARVCELIDDMVLVDDADFPTTDTPPTESIAINALGVWVSVSYPNLIPNSVTLVNTSFPAVALVEGVDYITGDGGIYLLTNATTIALDVVNNYNFAVTYSVSLLGNGVCQPTGRKSVKISQIQVDAKPLQIAIKYCDMELFQIQAKYGSDFAQRVLRRVVEQLREFIDKKFFQQIWVSALTNGSAAQSWSQSTETEEQLIQKISTAAATLIDSECVMPSDVIVITDILTADILGRANSCCRIDATNNGANLGQVGTLTQHSYPLYSIESTNLVYTGKVLVTTRYYFRSLTFQPLTIKEMVGGVEKPFTAPSGVTYTGRAMETEWIAFTQIASLVLRPTQARVINVVA